MAWERSIPAELIAPVPADVEVGDLLDDVEDTLGRLVRENHRLRTKLVAIGSELDRLRHLPPSASPSVPPPAAIPAGSDREPPMLTMAKLAAANYLDDAHRTAGELISEARRGADQIIRDAQASANAIERSARHWHSETLTDLESRCAALERDLDELREREYAYRMRIQADLRHRLYEVGDSDPGG